MGARGRRGSMGDWKVRVGRCKALDSSSHCWVAVAYQHNQLPCLGWAWWHTSRAASDGLAVLRRWGVRAHVAIVAASWVLDYEGHAVLGACSCPVGA